mmetsp:Transcript_24725/g.59265  ORF Transcript_24725/g.59265 Transcript_24725/m.59265 type:complete len:203 (-) Transcript_24725:160-768(-)
MRLPLPLLRPAAAGPRGAALCQADHVQGRADRHHPRHRHVVVRHLLHAAQACVQRGAPLHLLHPHLLLHGAAQLQPDPAPLPHASLRVVRQGHPRDLHPPVPHLDEDHRHQRLAQVPHGVAAGLVLHQLPPHLDRLLLRLVPRLQDHRHPARRVHTARRIQDGAQRRRHGGWHPRPLRLRPRPQELNPRRRGGGGPASDCGT